MHDSERYPTRQVDLDELTYQIYAGLRRWNWTMRRQVFAPVHQRRDAMIAIAADAICPNLKVWTFLDPAAGLAAVELERISALLAGAIPTLPGAIGQLWLSRIHDREHEAQAAAAILLARALDRFEILADTVLDRLGVRVPFRMPAAPDYAFAARWP